MEYFKKSMESNYGGEIGKLLKQQTYRLFEQNVQEGNLYRDCSQFELKLILRYHTQAVCGLLQDWTEEDTRNLDRIVHTVYLTMTGGVTSFTKLP